MAQYSALRCVSGIWQNSEKPLISNRLRFIFTCLLTAALWVLFHCFRHTYATLQLTKGTDIYTVSKMLGHKKVTTTQIYAKIVDEKKEAAADAIRISLSDDMIKPSDDSKKQ